MRKIFRRTDWRFVTSGGSELTVGVSRLFGVGGGIGAFYVRKGQGPIYRLPYAGAIASAGRGVFSAAGIVNVGVSLPWAPGGGFTVYQNPLRTDTFGLEDFEGSFWSFAAGVTVGTYSRSYTAILFGAPRWVAAAGALQSAAFLAGCAGCGVLWGSAITSSVAASITVVRGDILATQREQGETSYPVPDGVSKVL